MQKQKINLMLFLSLFLSGCIRSNKKTRPQSQVTKQAALDNDFVREDGTYVFNDEADEFCLDDDAADVFNGKMTQTGDEFEWDDITYDSDAGEVIQFDFDDARIKPAEKRKVARNADLAKQEISANPNSKVSVKGHSCKIAKSELYNRAISQERAENVAKAYAEQGVPRSKINAVGYGASELLTDEDGREAQGINRRVETDFISE